MKIISNVIKNSSYFQPFIIGDESLGISIIDQKMYKSHVSKDGVYGGEVEIQSFVQIYNLKIFIYRDNNPKPYEIGPSNRNNGVLTVLLSGVVDAGHYDVMNCSNSHFWENYKKQYNHDYHEKRKDFINVKKTSKNLTESMLFNQRNLDKIVHMSEDRMNKKRNKDLIGNMTVERATKKRKKDLIDNMAVECVIKKRNKDVVQNLNEDRLRKKREKDVVRNLDENRLRKKRGKDVMQNLNDERLRKKREKDVVQSLNEERLRKKREKDVVQNLNEDRLKKQRERYRWLYGS